MEVEAAGEPTRDCGQELQVGQEADRTWREERRERVAASLERVDGRYGGVTDFLTRLGIVMGVVALIGVLTVVVVAMVGGIHLAKFGLLLMALGLVTVLVVLGLAGLCWLVRSGFQHGFRKWARWQAIDLDRSRDE